MTRINVVPPEVLSNKHLLAEYRELPRVFTLAKAWYEKGADMSVIPDSYRLGSGHVKFFYNKTYYLHLRYESIVKELRNRNFELDNDIVIDVLASSNEILDNYIHQIVSWHPSPRDCYLSMARLVKRGEFEDAIDEMRNSS